MIRFRFFNFLNRHSFLQTIFCLLPIAFSIIYIYAYMTDFSNVYGSAVANTEYLKSSTYSETLVPVESITKTDKGYDVDIKISERKNINTTTSYLMSVYYYDDNWLKVIFQNQEYVYVPSNTFKFLTDINKSKDGITFNLSDKRYKAFDKLIFKVYTIDEASSKKDKFLLDIGESGDTVVKKIKSVSLSTGTYSYHVNYKKTVSAQDLVFCIDHFKGKEKDNTYYDIRTTQCIKELTGTEIRDFINRSNIYMFMISMMFYIGVLAVINQKKLLNLLNKRIIIVNVIGFLVLPLLFIIPYAMIN